MLSKASAIPKKPLVIGWFFVYSGGMTREIKFRIWAPEEKRIYGNATIKQYIEAPGVVIPEGEEKYIMQYTGLKDKDGFEIYEGDIVMHPSSNFPTEVFIAAGVTQPFDYSGEHSSEFEILGNIYENPELLKLKYHVKI